MVFVSLIIYPKIQPLKSFYYNNFRLDINLVAHIHQPELLDLHIKNNCIGISISKRLLKTGKSFKSFSITSSYIKLLTFIMIKQFSLMNNTKGLLWKNKTLNLCHHRKYANNIQECL